MPGEPTHLKNSTRCVFLDRDGVINHKMQEGQWVTSSSDFVMLDGVAEAIALLNRLAIKVVVVTNQRGLAIGRYSETDLQKIHQKMRGLLAEAGAHVDAIYFCPHERDTCECRKPKPGMFNQCFKDFPGTDSVSSLMIGDSLSDIEAGSRLGMATVFIRGDENFQAPGAARAESQATYTAESLGAFIHKHFA